MTNKPVTRNPIVFLIRKTLLSPWKTILVFVASQLLAATLLMLVEHGQGLGFWDAFYLSDITSMSVGYGDYSPKTWVGRFLITYVFTKLWLVVLLPTLAAHIVVWILVSKNTFTHNEQEWIMLVLQRVAAALGIATPPQPHDNDIDPALLDD